METEQSCFGNKSGTDTAFGTQSQFDDNAVPLHQRWRFCFVFFSCEMTQKMLHQLGPIICHCVCELVREKEWDGRCNTIKMSLSFYRSWCQSLDFNQPMYIFNEFTIIVNTAKIIRRACCYNEKQSYFRFLEFSHYSNAYYALSFQRYGCFCISTAH